ncbi:MAG: glutathione-disulfide reductase [Sandaracinaceae bacterium]
MAFDVDLFTIGAGSGGVRASRLAARAGARVMVAEMQRFGGTCVNVGCIPKKLYVYASKLRHDLAHAAGFGWTFEPGRFDMAALRANKDREIERLNGVYERVLRASGCDILRGRATVVDEHTVDVALEGDETKRVTAERILVATGSHPVRPTEPGTDRAWVSDDVFELTTLPKRLLVVGGGYIALEMASVFRGLGSEVTLAHRGAHVLRGFDEDVHTFVVDELKKHGIDVHLNCRVECLEPTGDAYSAMLTHGRTVDVDAALFAIGREPNTRGFGLEELGVATNDRGAIKVDAHYRSSVPSIYAIGDATDRLNLTPVALAEAGVLVDNIFLGQPERTLDYANIPTAVFSLPPVAAVGLTEADARSRGHELAIYTSEFRPLKHTLSGAPDRMFMKLVVDAPSDRVLGVHLVGDEGPEIIQGFAVALQLGATKAQLDATIGLHPTAAEELVTMRELRGS